MCRVDEKEKAAAPTSMTTNTENNATEMPEPPQQDDHEASSTVPEPVADVPQEQEDPVNNGGDHDDNKNEPKEYFRTDPSEYDSFLERYSVRIARRPCLHFWIALVVCLGIGMVGLVLGDFSVAVDNAGWYSRGTLIADRHQQYRLVDVYRPALFADQDGSFWENLETQRQMFVADDDDDDGGRRLDENAASVSSFSFSTEWETLGSQWHAGMQFLPDKRGMFGEPLTHASIVPRKNPQPAAQDWVLRRLQAQTSLGPLEGCNVNWYNSSALFEESRLWPVYQNKLPNQVSLWDGPALQEMCEVEAVTQAYLEQHNLCLPCDDENPGRDDEDKKRCLQPYSPVLFARLTVDNGLTMSCEELAQAWSASYQAGIEQGMASCVEAIVQDYNPDQDGAMLPENACPAYFFPHMLDENYPLVNDYVSHASAIYATPPRAVDDLYDAVDHFGYGGRYMETFYDTQFEDLVEIKMDEQVMTDMALAVGSAGITLVAMVVHTRSPFLALVGLLQIVLSFPLAFFFYHFVARLRFFPFLNFIGLFVRSLEFCWDI